jgi:hypothetical protein
LFGDYLGISNQFKNHLKDFHKKSQRLDALVALIDLLGNGPKYLNGHPEG